LYSMSYDKNQPIDRLRTKDGGLKKTSTKAGRVIRERKPKTEAIPSALEPARLNRVIADAGIASRRAADVLITEGRVKINGQIVTELGTKVSLSDVVSVNGEPITREKHLTYVLLNKPKDVITTSNDEKGRATVFDIVRIHARLFTVGRLDRNTTGAILLTNDGDLAHKLMHPSFGVSRVYRAGLDKYCRQEHARAISHGVELDDGMTSPCSVTIDPEDKSSVILEIREGKNREVRRLFEHFGYEVRRLDRKQYGVLTTRGLKRGEYRHLTREEINALRQLVGMI